MNTAAQKESIMDAETTYRISELATEFDVTLRTLRFYEDKGLLAPRRIGNTRLYSRTDRAKLKLILIAKRLGFSLIDIKAFLELYNPKENNLTQLKFALEKGEEQMINLIEEERNIKAAIGELEETMVTLRKMVADAS